MKLCSQCSQTRNQHHKFCHECGAGLVDDDVTCNLCGLTCIINDNSPATGNHGLIRQAVVGAYASTPGNGHGALDDLVSYNFSLCEFCLDWLFEQFQVPPETRDVVSGTNERFRPAHVRVTVDEWRTMKEEFLKERELRNLARSRTRASLQTSD